ncbi:RNA-binding protein 42 [Smittium mucronatum]|uniref:RNA-binding protein 42 n=1 Tax=Smittium mucronatum TaxID=133383 RepID=A0A1R0GYY0_9FUNG|nr:RNA-binding protein 42 [Smittium mucronatum]
MYNQQQPTHSVQNQNYQSGSAEALQASELCFYPLPVTVSKADMAKWQWLQDSNGYTFAYDSKSKEYYYIDPVSGNTYDYTPYYTGLGYVDGKLPASKIAAANSKFAKAQALASASSNTSETSKKRKIVRAAGGELWVDPTLEEWNPNDYRIFVGDLGKEVTDDILQRAFSAYPSVDKIRVVREGKTGYSKGYGFVSFLDPNDFAKAFKEMNGKTLTISLFIKSR